jgi:hypothetical protein
MTDAQIAVECQQRAFVRSLGFLGGSNVRAESEVPDASGPLMREPLTKAWKYAPMALMSGKPVRPSADPSACRVWLIDLVHHDYRALRSGHNCPLLHLRSSTRTYGPSAPFYAPVEQGIPGIMATKVLPQGGFLIRRCIVYVAETTSASGCVVKLW